MAEPTQIPALPNELPVVPLRGAVVLPLTVAPLGAARDVLGLKRTPFDASAEVGGARRPTRALSEARTKVVSTARPIGL